MGNIFFTRWICRRVFLLLMSRHVPKKTALQSTGRSRLTGIVLVVFAVVLWSTVPVGTRLLVKSGGAFSVGFLSAIRLWIAAIIFIVMRLLYIRRTGNPFTSPSAPISGCSSPPQASP